MPTFKISNVDFHVERMGAGLVAGGDELIPVKIAWAMGDYVLGPTARPGGKSIRLAGGYYDGHNLGGIEGAVKATLPKMVLDLLNKFKYEMGREIFYAGAQAMYEVLQEAVVSAPFWDKELVPRPEEEGPHLQESGRLVYGMAEDKVIAYVDNILGTERDSEVTRDEVVYNPPKDIYIKNDVQFWIKFYRINPRTGWDVSLWLHENLLHPRSKYLEDAFQRVQPEKQIMDAMVAYVRSAAPDKVAERKALQAIRHALTKGEKTWRGI